MRYLIPSLVVVLVAMLLAAPLFIFGRSAWTQWQEVRELRRVNKELLTGGERSMPPPVSKPEEETK